MKGVHQMREDYTEDMELNKEMEDIRQVPLEPGSRTAPGRERPVGASYTGGAARPGRGAPGMDEGMGRAARPRSGASGLDEGVGRAARPRSGASGFDGGVGRAARPRSGASGLDEGVGRAARPGNGAPGLDEGMGRAVRPGRGAAQTGSQGYGRSRARGNREAQEVRTRQARTVPAEEEGRRGRPGTAGPGRPKPGINGPASRLLNQRRVKSRSGRMTRQGSSPLIPREKYHGAAKKGKVFPLWRSCLC